VKIIKVPASTQRADRTRWDQTMIARGMSRLHESAAGGDVSEYHLQRDCRVPRDVRRLRSDGLARILALYDRLMEFDDSPVVALNRAVAVANVDAGSRLKAVRAIRDRKIRFVLLFYSVIGELEMRLNNREAAPEQFVKHLNSRKPIGASVPFETTTALR